MTTFDERETGFEAKFAHDADTEFRIAARANKLFGQWAAGKLGLTPEASDDYARSVVHADLQKAGTADVLDKVTADLAARDLGISATDIRAAMAAALAEARAQIGGAA